MPPPESGRPSARWLERVECHVALCPAVEFGYSDELQSWPRVDDAEVREHVSTEARFANADRRCRLDDRERESGCDGRESGCDGERGWLRGEARRASTRPWHVGVALRHAPNP